MIFKGPSLTQVFLKTTGMVLTLISILRALEGSRLSLNPEDDTYYHFEIIVAPRAFFSGDLTRIR